MLIEGPEGPLNFGFGEDGFVGGAGLLLICEALGVATLYEKCYINKVWLIYLFEPMPLCLGKAVTVYWSFQIFILLGLSKTQQNCQTIFFSFFTLKPDLLTLKC